MLEILGLKNVDASSFEQQKKAKYLPKELELINLSANVYNRLIENVLEISYDGDIKKTIRLLFDEAKKYETQFGKEEESESDEEMELDEKV